MNKVADGILGGWKVSGVLTAHTGFPLTIKVAAILRGRALAASAPTWWDAAQSAPDRTGRVYLDLARLRRSGSYVRNSAPRRGTRTGHEPPRHGAQQALQPDGEEVLRTPRRSLWPDQHADLREPGIADHHVGAVWTDPQREGERNMQVVAKFYF